MELINITATIDEYLRQVMEKSMQDMMTDGTYIAVKKDQPNILTTQITVQHCYNTKTNKAYIEYDFNEKFRETYSVDKMSKFVNKRINGNFKRDIEVWPEIILVEDDVHEVCDSSLILTPYTIGYWKSIYGSYEFLIDKAEVIQASSILNMTAPDVKPDKKFEDFCDIVKSIHEKYAQTILSEDDKNKYITEYQDIFVKYHSDTTIFNEKLSELKSKYSLKTGFNDKVPTMFQEYKVEYVKFFKTTLPNLDPFITKSYFEVGNRNN